MTKSRNYNKKIRKNAKLKTQPQEFDDEPKPKIHLTAFKLNVANPTDWYELFNIWYYEHLQNIYNIIWKDVYDKSGDIQLETQIKVADLTVKDITTTTTKKKQTKRNIWEPKRKRGKQYVSNRHRWKSIWWDNTIKKTNIILLLFTIVQIWFLYKVIENPFGWQKNFRNWTQTHNHLVHKRTLNHSTLKCVRDVTRIYSQKNFH